MRYLPLSPADRAQMLATIGAASIDDLFVDVPQAARKAELFDLPLHAGEPGGAVGDVDRRVDPDGGGVEDGVIVDGGDALGVGRYGIADVE